MAVDHAAEEGLDSDGCEGADADAEEGEAGFSNRPTADFTEDDWIGDETEVENCVDDGDVQVPEYAMRRGKGDDVTGGWLWGV